MHSAADLASGVADLPVADLWKIARTPDASVLLTAEGIEEIMEVLAGIGEAKVHWGRRLVRRVAQHLPGG